MTYRGPVISNLTHKLLGVVYNKEHLTYKAFDPQFQKDLDALGKGPRWRYRLRQLNRR